MTMSVDESTEQQVDGTHLGSKSSDVATAIRNAIKLGLSLVVTWGLALIVRIQLPRHLGPHAFGEFNFSEAFAGAFFVFVGFGLETYVQKEVSVRPQHASDFFGGVLVVRAILSVVLIGAMTVTLIVTNRPVHLQWLVLVFALSSLVGANSQLFSSMLRASTSVGALATINVVSKLLWAVGLIVGITFNVSLQVLALPALFSELLRMVVLWRAAKKTVGLELRFDRVATRKVLRASLPFFANAIAVALINRLDVSLLEFLAPGPEVGWYSAANNLAALALLMTPLLGWILMPLLARAKRRSLDEYFSILRRALEGFLIITIPFSLMVALGAEFWVRIIFGVSFAPAAMSLRILSPIFVATYACMVLSVGLILNDRPWLTTVTSLCGIALQPLISISVFQLIKNGAPGSAGAAVAVGVCFVEMGMAAVLLWQLGNLALDRRNVQAVIKSIAVAGVIIVVDHSLRSLGPVRLVFDCLGYVLLAMLVQVERFGDLRHALNVVKTRGKDTTALSS
jgi:O-antigen/teichoic acid export membrane protein